MSSCDLRHSPLCGRNLDELAGAEHLASPVFTRTIPCRGCCGGGRRAAGAGGAGVTSLEEQRVLGPLLISPAVLFVVVVVGVPLGWAIYLSMTNAIGGSLSGKFVGFDNFRAAWRDQNFRNALENTLIITFSVQAIVVVSAAVALAMRWSATSAASGSSACSSCCRGRRPSRS